MNEGSLQTLTSARNPRVLAAAKLASARDRRQTGLCLVEGVREVDRALEAGLTPRELFWCPELLPVLSASVRDRLDADPRLVAHAYRLPQAVLAKLAYRERPEGIIATFDQPTWTMEQAFECAHGKPGLFLVAVGLEKPGNLGAMARTADATGADAVFVADGQCDPFNPNAIRAGTGAVFHVPIVPCEGAALRTELSRRGIQIVATSPQGSHLWCDVNMTVPTAIVIGAEDQGLPPDWLSGSDASVVTVSIPMRGQIADSLNASVAAAVLLYEAVRQRHHR